MLVRVTLPASASVGDQIIFVDYAELGEQTHYNRSEIQINFQGGTNTKLLTTSREAEYLIHKVGLLHLVKFWFNH
jgi:hypothetical protein